MNLIEAFKIGKVRGMGTPDKIIETQISNVFIYEDKAIKVYKSSDAFFGNLGEKSFRQEFYNEDFTWNQWMSPEIYTALKPACLTEGNWSECDLKQAEDFYVEMNKVDTSQDLTNLLLNNAISDPILFEIGKIMTFRINALTATKKQTVNAFNRTWRDLLEERFEDLKNFSYIAEPKISREETDAIIARFYEFVKSSDYINNFNSSDMVVYIDNHSDNILALEGSVSFIDIYPVKENWRAVDPYHNICRTMADVCVLGTKEQSEEMLNGYLATSEAVKGPEDVKSFYMAYNAMIKAAYYYIIGKNDLADKFFAFVNEK